MNNPLNRLRSISLRTMLSSVFVTQILIVSGLIIYFSYQNRQQAVDTLVSQIILKMEENVEIYVQSILATPEQINRINRQDVEQGRLDLNDLAAVEQRMYERIQQFDTVATLLFGRSDGAFRSVHRSTIRPGRLEGGYSNPDRPEQFVVNFLDQSGQPDTEVIVLDPFPVQTRPWYQQAAQRRQAGWTDPFQVGGSPELVVSAYLPLLDAQSTLQGVFAVNFNLRPLQTFVQSAPLCDGCVMVIVNDQDYVIATSSDDPLFQLTDPLPNVSKGTIPPGYEGEFERLRLQDISSVALQTAVAELSAARSQASNPAAEPRSFSSENQRYWLQVSELDGKTPGLNWSLMIVVPESAFTSGITMGRSEIVLWLGIMVAIVVMISMGIAAWITKPLHRLQQTAAAIASGNLDMDMAPVGVGSVYHLSQAFMHMQQQLRQSFETIIEHENQLEAIINHMPMGVGVFDPSGRLVLVNQRGQDIFHHQTPDAAPAEMSQVYQVYQVGTDELYPTERLPIIQALAGQSAQVEDIEVEIHGQRVPLEVYAAPILDRQGEVKYAVNMFQDISDRKQAAALLYRYNTELEAAIDQRTQELQASESRFRGIFLYSAVGTVLVDSSCCIIQANEAFCTMLGYSESELKQCSIKDITHPDDIELSLEQIQPLLQGEPAVHGLEKRYLHRKGDTVWGLLSIALIRDLNGHPLHLITQVQNITQRKTLEAKLQAAKDDAETANQGKSAFLANMSHELRTPLNAILGYPQLLMASPNLLDQDRLFLQTIINSGEYLLNLINQILDLSKIEAGRMTLNISSTNLHDLLRDLDIMLAPKAIQKGLNFIIDQEEDIPRLIQTDGVKLQQILINLLNNAIKFTDTGSVVLRVTVDGEDNQCALDQCRLCFSVMDTGVGIDDVEIDHVFQMFMQTQSGRQQHEGTGLGLAISYRFVEMLGGILTVESEVGQGTEFQFTIQTQRQTVSTAPEIQQPLPMKLLPGQPQYTILVVEDNPVNRLLLGSLLKNWGFTVIEAVDGEEAIAQWQAHHPDLIFMDIRMPKLDGDRALATIQRQATDTPPITIAVTAIAFEQDREILLTQGFTAVMNKPFRSQEIVELLQHYLGVQFAQSLPENSPAVIPLTSADLQQLPEPWLHQFYEVVQIGHGGQMTALIAELDPEYDAIALSLLNLVEAYEFDQLYNLLNLIL